MPCASHASHAMPCPSSLSAKNNSAEPCHQRPHHQNHVAIISARSPQGKLPPEPMVSHTTFPQPVVQRPSNPSNPSTPLLAARHTLADCCSLIKYTKPRPRPALQLTLRAWPHQDRPVSTSAWDLRATAQSTSRETAPAHMGRGAGRQLKPCPPQPASSCLAISS